MADVSKIQLRDGTVLNIKDETARANNEENSNDITNLKEAVSTNTNDLNTEIENRKSADKKFEESIENETKERKTTDENFEKSIETINENIDNIEGKISAQATSENQLADKDFVNSSISTSTATFKRNI